MLANHKYISIKDRAALRIIIKGLKKAKTINNSADKWDLIEHLVNEVLMLSISAALDKRIFDLSIKIAKKPRPLAKLVDCENGEIPESFWEFLS